MTHHFHLKLMSHNSHQKLLGTLGKFQEVKSGSQIFLLIDFSNYFLHSDILLLIVAIVDYTKSRGVRVIVSCHGNRNWDSVKYAQRINFFSLLGIRIEEEFQRANPDGRFIEISKFGYNSNLEIQDKIMLIIRKMNLPEGTYGMLAYCFNEVIDNMFNHAEIKNGWISMQHYPRHKKIRLMICDTGIGICSALRQCETYKDIDERTALEKCIVRGVTNGKGQGFGLYATSEFITQNQGVLSIYSGNHNVVVNKSKIVSSKSGHWPGTFVFLEANCDISVDYKKIVNSGFVEHFVERMYDLDGEKFTITEKLW